MIPCDSKLHILSLILSYAILNSNSTSHSNLIILQAGGTAMENLIARAALDFKGCLCDTMVSYLRVGVAKYPDCPDSIGRFKFSSVSVEQPNTI